jgi:type IV pilus assembly protein PilN
MDDENKNLPNDLVDENLNDKKNETESNDLQNSPQSEGESKQEHRVIHKKNDKLHIYVRQDKYKGELKSKNWVGRTFINGKQKVSSSGTTNLDEAIPILEKWFDDLHANEDDNNKNAEKHEEITKNVEPIVEDNNEIFNENNIGDKPSQTGLKSSMFEKLKNIKFGKSKNEGGLTPESKAKGGGKKKLESFFKNIFQSKVSKLSVAGEEIAGLDITKDAIRVCQVSQDKDENWILDKFSYRLLDQEKVTDNVLENKDYIAEEINLAMANAKITSKNIAMSIPVTSAIIRVVTSPLMTDEELQKAIETDSLWENLVQLTDNLNDYSIFHQIINRNSKNNTMEILFVASKLSDVNSYSGIVKKAGLNPVIVDVKCFTLKNAYDNSKFKTITDKGNSAILEISPDENYLMIIHNNTPIITDVFLRQPEKELISQIIEGPTNTEAESVVRRYAMQIKQALSDYEGKHENKITNIQVVSSLKNISNLLPVFKKNLPTVGFSLFDPLEGVAIPSYNTEKTNINNKSTIAPVIGLAYRKLDVFGYYKFVTAVKNINLLPNRDAIRQQGRMKFLSGFAFKGLAISIAAIYLFLIGLSFFQINSNKKILADFDQVQMEFDKYNLEFSKLIKKKREMDKSLELGKLVNSNQTVSYRALAQITRSVPIRVNFNKMTFDGANSVIIEGMAFSDQDILNFISNLNAKSLIDQASLAAMKVESESNQSNNKKGFIINCKLKI